MSLVFTPTTLLPEGQGLASGGGYFELFGTLTASGSYATGGDTFATGKNPEDLLKRVGAGRVLWVDVGGGWAARWDATAKKLLLYVSGGTEVSAAAYAAGLTAGVPCVIRGR